MSRVDVHVYPNDDASFRIVAVVEPEEMLLGAEDVTAGEGLALTRAMKVAVLFESVTGLRARVVPYEQAPSWASLIEVDAVSGFSHTRRRLVRRAHYYWHRIAHRFR